MKIEFLGSGGALPTPALNSHHPFAQQARQKGVPYTRFGPSLFIHDCELLIDTPEEIRLQLERAGIYRVPHCLYSHWHPDHTRGMRVFESLNWTTWQYPRENQITDIYLPEQAGIDMRGIGGMADALDWMSKVKIIRVHDLKDGDHLMLGDFKITPFRVAEDYVYAFLFEGQGKRVLIAPDELFGWSPPEFVQGVDLAILPMGICEFNPFTGERFLPTEHPVLRSEATFRQTLAMLETLNAQQVIMTHIEDCPLYGYDELLQLEKTLKNIRFAYDTLIVEI